MWVDWTAHYTDGRIKAIEKIILRGKSGNER
jgi:hypothetical protein